MTGMMMTECQILHDDVILSHSAVQDTIYRFSLLMAGMFQGYSVFDSLSQRFFKKVPRCSEDVSRFLECCKGDSRNFQRPCKF